MQRMKFSDLVPIHEEPVRYVLNDRGQQLVQKYIAFSQFIQKYAGKNTVSILSDLEVDENANFFMSPMYKIAKRLATATQDGRQSIDGTYYTFNDKDEIMLYLDKEGQ